MDPRVLLALAAATMLGLAACGPVEGQHAPEQPSTVRNGNLAVQRCSNPRAGYAIAYPEGWQTNLGEVIARCRLFGPQLGEVEAGTEVPLSVPIFLQATNRPFPAQSPPNDPGLEIISSQRTQVNGHRALILRGQGTGEGLIPQGMATYQYLVDIDGSTLIAATYGAGDLAFSDKMAVLDQMMTTFDVPTH